MPKSETEESRYKGGGLGCTNSQKCECHAQQTKERKNERKKRDMFGEVGFEFLLLRRFEAAVDDDDEDYYVGTAHQEVKCSVWIEALPLQLSGKQHIDDALLIVP